jgi:hypothetical protein
MQALVPGVAAAIVAMLSAIVRIRVAKANAYVPRKAKSDRNDRHGPYDRISRFLQCTQNAHCWKVYHNPFPEVKSSAVSHDYGRRIKNPFPPLTRMRMDF